MSKKKNLFENATITSTEAAKQLLENSVAKLNRVKIGLIVAAVATLISVIGYKNDGTSLGGTLLFIGFICSMASYIIGGGFMTAISWAAKIGKLGWFIMPFPIDIITGICAVMISFIAFMFLPLVFVFLSYVQTKKDYEEANKFLLAAQAANA